MTAPQDRTRVRICNGDGPTDDLMTVELRNLRETLEFIEKTADQYIVEGGSPHLLVVDVLTFASLYCRGVTPIYGGIEIVCGNYTSEKPTMTIVDKRGFSYSAKLFFAERQNKRSSSRGAVGASCIDTAQGKSEGIR